MKFWQIMVMFISGVAMFACSAPQAPVPDGSPSPEPEVSLSDLACAEVQQTEPLQLNYGMESLYRNGALMPTVDGLKCLENLADWLKKVPKKGWQVKVGRADIVGLDPEKLTAKRQELLQQFFSRKGVDLSAWQWQAANELDSQLILTHLP